MNGKHKIKKICLYISFLLIIFSLIMLIKTIKLQEKNKQYDIKIEELNEEIKQYKKDETKLPEQNRELFIFQKSVILIPSKKNGGLLK